MDSKFVRVGTYVNLHATVPGRVYCITNQALGETEEPR